MITWITSQVTRSCKARIVPPYGNPISDTSKTLSRTASWSCSCGPILMTRYSEAIFGTTVKSRLGRCLFCCSRPGCALGPALVLSGDCVGYLRRMPEYQHNSFPSRFAFVLDDQDCFAECRF